MTLRHWQMEKVSGSAEPLLSTTGNKGLNSSGGSTIVYDSTALFGKSSVRSKHFFDTDAAGSLSDNEFTIGFWFYVPTGTEERFIFQLGLHNTNVSTNGHTCVGLYYTYYSNKIFFTTGYKTDNGGRVELGSLSRNVWHHCYISRTNSGTNSTLQVKITATDGTVVHDNSQVYTKADFSIDESGTGQYSYFNGHPAGGSLTLGNGRIEDFILKNGSVLSYASIYNSSAEVFQSDEPQVSVSTGAGSATLSDSNFTGTKTYSFYDTDAETLLQSGTSNSYTSYASSSVAYTALVTDTDNNRVISTFYISQGGNDMAYLSGSSAIPYQVHSQFLGGIITNASTNAFQNLPVTGSDGVTNLDVSAGAALSSNFVGSNSTLISALNYLDSQIVGNELAAGVGIDSTTFAAGTINLSGSALASGDVAVAEDTFIMLDADGSAKQDTIANLISDVAGDGLGASAGVLAVQVGSNKGLALTSDALEVTGSAISSYTVNVGTDEIVFLDADGTVKKDTIADLATAQAGNGIAASSGQFAIDGADANTWSGIQKYGVDKLYVSGTNALGQPKYFSFKVDGGVLVLSEQNA